MAKKVKATKKRADKYAGKLHIIGSLDGVLKASLPKKKAPKKGKASD